MSYYHDLITEKSYRFLQKMRREFDFVLIGGWAVYLYTQGLKSRDIDIICDYEVLEKFRDKYELIKNDRLKKYEIHAGEFDVDIYVPFYSDLGIPAEDIKKTAKTVSGFSTAQLETLLILKQHAWRDRMHSLKGEKDRFDIIALMRSGVDFVRYKSLLKKYGMEDYGKDLKNLLSETNDAPELGLNKYAYAKLKSNLLKKF